MGANPRYPNNAQPAPSIQRPAPLDEVSLMEKIATGDQDALMIIYDRYSSLIYALSLHVLRNPQSAEDATQEVFLRLSRKAKAFNAARGTLVSWLTVMARHQAIDALRRRQRETRIADAVIPIDRPHSNAPDYSGDRTTVRSILEKLPTQQREVLDLAYFAGFTHTEIAKQTGKPLGTVKSQIRLALQSLRRMLIPAGNGTVKQ